MPDDIRPEVRSAWKDVGTLRRRREELLGSVRDGGVDRGQLLELDEKLRDVLIGIQDLVDPCDASAEEPLVLLPVRLETRYSDGPQGVVLKVRVYPDEIHVDDLARGLSEQEVAAAQAYWKAAWADPVPEGAFDALVAAVGARRAGWVAYACTPTNLAARGVDPPTFPSVQGSSTRNIVARVLPDRFTVVIEQSGRVAKATGAPIPPDLPLGLIPLEGDQPITDEDQLSLATDSTWLVDYDEAVKVGMAITVPLPAGREPIARVTVVGTRPSDSPEAAAAELADVLVGHRYSAGLSLLAQGSPTNNSDGERSPYRARPTPIQPALTPTTVVEGSDAAAAAANLGLDPTILTAILGPGYGEQSLAKATNSALWAPGWGAFLDILDDGGSLGITDAQRESARRLFSAHVRGRGPSPALAVRAQPYGVLPVSDLATWKPEAGETTAGVLQVVRGLMSRWLRVIDRVVDRVRPDAADADETLLEILGASPVMQGLRVRPYVSGDVVSISTSALGLDPNVLAAEQSIRSAVAAEVVGASVSGLRMGSLDDHDRALPLALASDRDPEFIGELLAGRSPKVDSVLQALLALAWASEDLDALRASPATVLPDLMVLAEVAEGISTQAATLISRAEDASPAEFHELANQIAKVSKAPIGGAGLLATYQPIPAVATSLADVALAAPDGTSATMLANSAIAGWLRAMGYRAEVRDAMRHLATVTTAERALALGEALDCSSHRLDAWATGIVAERAAHQRAARRNQPGLTIGAWGVVEDLRPAQGNPGDGWIHAPSTRHATAAGILRNAHLAHVGGGGSGGPFELDLSSVRLDAATHLLDGIRSGQPLGALVGYQIERALAKARLARLQLSLRTIAPLVAEHLHESTGPDADIAREAVAATDVVDGLLLLRTHAPGDPALRARLDIAPVNAYLDPGDWRPLTDKEWAEVTRIMRAAADAVDALSDTLLAESVLHYAGGNPTRAAAAMDALGAGHAPSAEIDILDTQDAAERLTHRLLALVGSGAATAWNPDRPRALAEPALEAWASAHLGSPATIIVADLSDQGGPLVTLEDADWCALDLVHTPDQGILESALRAALPEVGAHALAVRGDPGWPAGARSLAQAHGLAVTLRQIISGGTAMLPDALARPGTSPTRTLDSARAELTARMTTAVAEFANTAATAQAALAAVPDDGIVADLNAAADVIEALVPLAAYGLHGIPIAERPLDVSWAVSLVESAAARSSDAQAVVAALAALPVDHPAPLVLDAAQGVAETVFGEGFLIVPVLAAPPAAEDFGDAVTDPALPQPATSRVRRWVTDHGTVREQVRRYAETLLVGRALGGDRAPSVVQLTERTEDGPAPGTAQWLAGPLPEGGPWPSAPCAHLVLDAVGLGDASGPLAGLVIDAWVEDLPNQPGPPKDPDDLQPHEEDPGVATTGLAIRANGASARPPQTILCAISPDGSRWTTDSLVRVIDSTLDLAKLRLVRLDTMPGDAVSLPALYVRSASLQGQKGLNFADLIAQGVFVNTVPFVKEVRNG